MAMGARVRGSGEDSEHGVVVTPVHVRMEARAEKPTVEDRRKDVFEASGAVGGGDLTKNADRRDEVCVCSRVVRRVAAHHGAHGRVGRREADERHGVRVRKDMVLDHLRGKDVHEFGTVVPFYASCNLSFASLAAFFFSAERRAENVRSAEVIFDAAVWLRGGVLRDFRALRARAAA